MNYNELKKSFDANTTTTNNGTFYTIKCKKGLWACSGSLAGKVAVENEARHYFVQYLQDGEYE